MDSARGRVVLQKALLRQIVKTIGEIDTFLSALPPEIPGVRIVWGIEGLSGAGDWHSLTASNANLLAATVAAKNAVYGPETHRLEFR